MDNFSRFTVTCARCSEKTAADIIYHGDHGTGEIADYVTVTREADTLAASGCITARGRRRAAVPERGWRTPMRCAARLKKSVVWAQSLPRLLKKIDWPAFSDPRLFGALGTISRSCLTTPRTCVSGSRSTSFSLGLEKPGCTGTAGRGAGAAS